MNCKIRYSRGHVEVLDELGNFLFSADSEYEARCELQAIETVMLSMYKSGGLR